MASLKPRLVKNGKVMTETTPFEKFDHWSGEEVSYDPNARTEPFAGFEDAYNALADQAADREEKDKDGAIKEGKDRNSLVLADLLDVFNGYRRRAAKAAAVEAKMRELGISEADETMFSGLVTTLRAKLDAKDKKPENLKTARQLALKKLREVSAILNAETE